MPRVGEGNCKSLIASEALIIGRRCTAAKWPGGSRIGPIGHSRRIVGFSMVEGMSSNRKGTVKLLQ